MFNHTKVIDKGFLNLINKAGEERYDAMKNYTGTFYDVGHVANILKEHDGM